MSRAGSLILAALIFAVAAGGIFYFLNSGKPLPLLGSSPAPAGKPEAGAQTATPKIPAARWVQDMSDAAADGGFVLTFAEKQNPNWSVSAGHKLERFSVESGSAVLARLSSSTQLSNDPQAWSERGLSFTFPMGFAQRTNGAKLEIGLVARRAPTNGAENIHIVYATQQAGNSGWQKLPLQPGFSVLKFNYDVPQIEGGYTIPPVVVIHADASGAGRAAEIIGIYVKPVK